MRKKPTDISITIDRTDDGGDIPSKVVSQIVLLISQQRLMPGDRLPSELEMTRRFGISRISLRESMRLLEAKGYIESKGRRGKYVCDITNLQLANPLTELVRTDRESLSSLFETKGVIAGESAFLAAQRATDEEIARIQEYLCEFRKSCASESLTAGTHRSETYSCFFASIYGSMKNAVFAHLNSTLTSVLASTISGEKETQFSRKKETQRMVIAQMEKIVHALASRRPDEAREATKAHIEYMKRAYTEAE